MVAALLMGADPMAKCSSGQDTLHNMAFFGRARNITRWCERFPTWDFNRRATFVGVTALGCAILFGPNKLEAVKALVQAGADPLGFTANTGTTVLHNTAANRDANEELVRYLLKLPGVRALIDQKMGGRTLKLKVQFLAARLLVKLGARAAILKTVSEWQGQTPLICAARNGNAAVIKVLVEEGRADVRPRNARKRSAMDALVGGKNALKESRLRLQVGAGPEE